MCAGPVLPCQTDTNEIKKNSSPTTGGFARSTTPGPSLVQLDVDAIPLHPLVSPALELRGNGTGHP